MLKKICLISCFFCLVGAARAQDEAEVYDLRADSSWVDRSRPTFPILLELGISGNAYRGDLSNYQKWSACYHAGIRFNRSRLINSRLGISFGFITGENRFYDFPGGTPNNFFRSSVFSLDYELHINLIKRPTFSVYLAQGIGLFRFQVRNDEGEDLFNRLDSRADGETFANNVFFLPTGIGANYFLKNGYGIGLQANILNTQTDYLDNISEWGLQNGNDNVLRFKFYIYAPLKIIPPKTFSPPRTRRRLYTHN
ncbi:MAG: hypothetical protein MUE85_06000 [Microscillaceae bacterium]|jgi:hypothetical protein|nr:hypothetical protein [Microscillaceae bacterium]